MWCWVRDSLGWVSCPSILVFDEKFLDSQWGENNGVLWWVMAAVGWSLWKNQK
jgi:hypothetical protein